MTTLEQDRQASLNEIDRMQRELAQSIAAGESEESRFGLMLGINDYGAEIMAIDRDLAIKRQLDAMALDVYRVGVLTVAPDGTKAMQNYNWRAEDVMKSLPRLRAMNVQGANINIGPPFGDHHLTMIDDVKQANIQQMKDRGFAPALVVETSHGNFQAWVNHGQVLPQDVRGAAAKELATEFGGDPGAAAHAHLGRLVGFTNRKGIRQLQDGSYPWVNLTESTGKVYPRANAFIAEVGKQIEQAKSVAAERARSYVPPSQEGPLKTREHFAQDLRYAGDGHRIDIAWARYAIARGVAPAVVGAQINARADIGKKGPEKAQQVYVEQTIRKASKDLGVGMAR